MALLLLNRNIFGHPSNKGKVLSKNKTLELLNTWVLNDRLKLHMHQVGYLMNRWAAEKELLNDEAQW